MAKINHSNYLDVVDNVWTAAKEKGIMHINSEEKSFDGSSFNIRGKELINFGTCGYLGLEKDPRMIESSIEMIRKYGTQLSMSRAYIRPPYIQELEELMSEIFDGNKVICYTSTSNAHISVIATIIKPDDLIILDQQVHFSVQFPCKHTKLQGTDVKMVKHSDYIMLDEMIRENYNKYNRIWYMADGVYSMHGDLPNTDELSKLLNKYPKLHLYFDDAHGMGWSGKNGAGYVYDKLGVSKRIIVISTLAKGFGCVGGTAIFSDPEMYRKVDIFGGPLSYSHPLSPGNVGAAIASAKIHLSNEIYTYQAELKELMYHLNNRLVEKNLPNLSSNDSPIYYIGSGLNKVTRNFVHRILGEGIYVNTATFPVVPNDKSGLRFTLTRHNTKAEIDLLTDAMAHHLPKAIEEEGENIQQTYKEFGYSFNSNVSTEKQKDNDLKIETYTSIVNINSLEWDSMFESRGTFSHSGMKCMEEIFSHNEKPEENWSFHYIIIRDQNNKIILATFFTGALYKDDMLSQEHISKVIEEERKKNPYHLCSKTLGMGALFSEGEYIYVNSKHHQFDDSIKLLLDFISETKKSINATVVILRDFSYDTNLTALFSDYGFTKILMPNTNILKLKKWNNNDELLAQLNSKNAKENIKRYAIKFNDKYDISYHKELSIEQAKEHYKLFSNVKNNNFAFNFFTYPEKITQILSKYSEWEFIELRIKETGHLAGSIWGYIGKNHYCPLIVGIDYDYLKSHHIYKQIMYYMVKRGNDLNKQTSYLGLTADYEKVKYGAKSIPNFAMIKFDSLYNQDILSSY